MYTIAILIALSVSGIFSLYRQYQMLQQNSYYPARYYKWLSGSYVVPLSLMCCGFCLISVLLSGNQPIIALILSAALAVYRLVAAIKTHKKSIKPLVFTSRIKRLFITSILIYTVLCILFAIFKNNLAGEIMKVAVLSLGFVTPLTALLSWAFTLPIEKTVSNYYINDAKKILKSHKSLKVIGITGSFGKTTTKFILNRILSERFNTVCTPQSFNTPMGVVRTVRTMIKPQTQIFICEMGAKKKKDIKEICDIAHPDFGIITSVGAQHLDTFKSIDNVYNTKFELAEAVGLKGGFTFINTDSPDIASRYDRSDKSLIAVGENQKYFADNISYGPSGSSFELHLAGDAVAVTTKLLGLHSVADILIAAALAHKLGVEARDIAFAIASLKPTEHRLELKGFNMGSLLIDDAYNSNPVGCLEAVRVLGSFEGYQKAVITPGLIELGDKEYESNYNLGLECTKYCDIIILVGKNRSKPMLDAINTTVFPEDKVFVATSFKEAMQIYSKFIKKDSVVLLENDLPDNYLN